MQAGRRLSYLVAVVGSIQRPSGTSDSAREEADTALGASDSMMGMPLRVTGQTSIARGTGIIAIGKIQIVDGTSDGARDPRDRMRGGVQPTIDQAVIIAGAVVAVHGNRARRPKRAAWRPARLARSPAA